MRSVIRPHHLLLIFLWCNFTLPGIANSTTVLDATTILVMGDSLSAGFGIDQSLGWVNLLNKRLSEQGYRYHVLNSSISGETSSGGLNRLPDALKHNKPDIVVIELGANDGLRGLSLDHLHNNLDKMVGLSKQSNAKVLLVGMELPPNYGPAYASRFRNVYMQLAKKHKIQLVPFLLDGVATKRKLMQSDNLHPTAEAQPQILDNIWPHLLPLLSKGE